MNWFRRKQQEIVEDAVEDATKIIKHKTSRSLKSYAPLIFAAAVAIDYLWNTGNTVVPDVTSKFTLYIENVNVTFHN